MSEDIERTLVQQYLELYAISKKLEIQVLENKKSLENVEAELISLLDDEDRKRSGSFRGIGYVTLEKPSVKQAWIEVGKEEILFDFLRQIDREDLIKTSVHHSSLSALINQRMRDNLPVPPGAGYIIKERLRPYPEKT